MGTVNPVGSSYTDQNVSAAVSKSTQELGQAEFLKLLVTQLQNQDPINPVNNEQFIAQLATFSSLEQLISINKGVTKLAYGMEDTQGSGTADSRSPV